MKAFFIFIGIFISCSSFAQNGAGNGGEPKELFLLNRAQTVLRYLNSDDANLLALNPDQKKSFLFLLSGETLSLQSSLLGCVKTTGNPAEPIVYSQECFDQDHSSEGIDENLRKGILAALGVPHENLPLVDWQKWEQQRNVIFSTNCEIDLRAFFKGPAVSLLEPAFKTKGYFFDQPPDSSLEQELLPILALRKTPTRVKNKNLADVLSKIPACLKKLEK
jgi:hypothetical protein